VADPAKVEIAGDGTGLNPVGQTSLGSRRLGNPKLAAGGALAASILLCAGCSPSSQAASPTGTPAATPSPPQLEALPPGVPAFFYSKAAGGPLLPVGWDGTRYAQVDLGALGASLPSGQAIQSPDGSKLLFGDTVYDRATASAVVLPFLDVNKGNRLMWADDNAHLCVMRDLGNYDQPSGTATELDLISPGGPTTVVAQVGRDVAQAFAMPRVCSIANDVAIVVQRAVAPISDVWMIKISTGAVLRHIAYPQGAQPGTVVASPDGRLIAAVGSTGSDILDAATGAALGRVQGEVIAFSGDGNLVVLADRIAAWRTGATTWRVPAGYRPIFVLAEPEGPGLAVDAEAAVPAPSTPGLEPPTSVVPQLWLVTPLTIVHIADGATPTFVTVN